MTEICRLAVRVLPGARKEGVGGSWTDGSGSRRLVVRVSAPPEDGQANAAVCAAVAEAFYLPKSAVFITAGPKSRLKMLAVHTGDVEAFSARLNALMDAQN